MFTSDELSVEANCWFARKLLHEIRRRKTRAFVLNGLRQRARCTSLSHDLSRHPRSGVMLDVVVLIFLASLLLYAQFPSPLAIFLPFPAWVPTEKSFPLASDASGVPHLLTYIPLCGRKEQFSRRQRSECKFSVGSLISIVTVCCRRKKKQTSIKRRDPNDFKT